MKPFFSIVFPTYNVSAFMTKALDDLLAQSYGNFEAIIVDDCATDGSGRIADSYSAKDERISVIHLKENGGVSNARNAGMDAANGEYILFWDPDDRYEHDLLKIVYESLMLANGEKSIAKKANPQMGDVDILYYSLSEDYYDAAGNIKKSFEITSDTAELFTKPEIFERVNELEQKTMLGYPWNKAYNLKYLKENNVRFQIVSHVEDILFNIAAVENARHIVVLADVLYHYRNMGQVRLTGKYQKDYLELQKLRIKGFLDLYKRQDMVNEAVLNNMAGVYFRSLFSYIERELSHGVSKDELLDMLNKENQDELFLELKCYLNGKRAVKLLYSPLVRMNNKSAITRASLVSFVKNKMPIVFAVLKQNR